MPAVTQPATADGKAGEHTVDHIFHGALSCREPNTIWLSAAVFRADCVKIFALREHGRQWMPCPRENRLAENGAHRKGRRRRWIFAYECAGVPAHTKGKKGKAAVPVPFRHIGFRQLKAMAFAQRRSHQDRGSRTHRVALLCTPTPLTQSDCIERATPPSRRTPCFGIGPYLSSSLFSRTRCLDG